jgi:hypothetical protein
MLPLPCGDWTVAYSVLISAVVFGDLLRPGVIRPEALPYRGSSQAADSVLFRSFQEVTAVDIAMHVTVKEVQQLLREIGGVLSFHVKCLLSSGKDTITSIPNISQVTTRVWRATSDGRGRLR